MPRVEVPGFEVADDHAPSSAIPGNPTAVIHHGPMAPQAAPSPSPSPAMAPGAVVVPAKPDVKVPSPKKPSRVDAFFRGLGRLVKKTAIAAVVLLSIGATALLGLGLYGYSIDNKERIDSLNRYNTRLKIELAAEQAKPWWKKLDVWW